MVQPGSPSLPMPSNSNWLSNGVGFAGTPQLKRAVPPTSLLFTEYTSEALVDTTLSHSPLAVPENTVALALMLIKHARSTAPTTAAIRVLMIFLLCLFVPHCSPT
ncbi:MAG TPA: hypothetical protein PKZ01_10440 [Candidatus Hydrogenedentes bacterium]|nr:hypothetical protein [Candidatus Hydrogenedentota bacterium]